MSDLDFSDLDEHLQNKLLNYHVTKKTCEECGEDNYYEVVAGHNKSFSCKSCGYEYIRVIG